LRWKLRTGEWQKAGTGVYLRGGDPPSRLELAVAAVKVTGGVASYSLAGLLHDLDSVELGEPFVTIPAGLRKARKGVRYRDLSPESVTTVHGVPCTDGTQTIIDLATALDDVTWEHALENAVRNKLTKIEALDVVRIPGVARIRRVLALRPPNAPPTESLLETLMVQLIRAEPRLPEPQRQVEVADRWGQFVARVDLAWPDKGVFIELDGEHHKDQPVYDARRETAVVAATGWLPGRFTWTEVTRIPKLTARRLVDIFTIRS
jgi:very-short-patch-repair endonuclease